MFNHSQSIRCQKVRANIGIAPATPPRYDVLVRRFGRKVAVAVCLLLAVAAVAGYRLGLGRCAGIGVVLAGNYWECGTFEHSMYVRFTRGVTVVPGFPRMSAWSQHVWTPIGYYNSDGYAPNGFFADRGEWFADRGTQQDTYWEAGVPLWFVATLALIPPALAARSWWQQRRRAAEGRCLICGYDLRASPDRCPECGTLVTAN
jgi:hypothetical protein